jgi:hypothetical protein
MGKVMVKYQLNLDYLVISMIFGGLRLRQFHRCPRGSLPAAGFALRARMSRQGGTAPHAFSIAKCEGGGHASAPFNSSEVGLIAVVSVPVLQRVALIIAV